MKLTKLFKEWRTAPEGGWQKGDRVRWMGELVKDEEQVYVDTGDEGMVGDIREINGRYSLYVSWDRPIKMQSGKVGHYGRHFEAEDVEFIKRADKFELKPGMVWRHGRWE
ncbi:MAG: hypothetical protein Q8K86_08850 [Candidatus Nanopelagicaceae bacterium]|nr:hypothetical protein [Candidatus Nanopelagicaceae bacterium]